MTVSEGHSIINAGPSAILKGLSHENRHKEFIRILKKTVGLAVSKPPFLPLS
jgi:hypothetical protein